MFLSAASEEQRMEEYNYGHSEQVIQRDATV